MAAQVGIICKKMIENTKINTNRIILCAVLVPGTSWEVPVPSGTEKDRLGLF